MRDEGKIQVPAIELDMKLFLHDGYEHFLTSESTITKVTIHLPGRTAIMTPREFFSILEKGIEAMKHV